VEDQRYHRARQRVKELKGFYTNVISYVCVNALLFLINLVTSPGHWWFQWVLFGWGIGVVAHAFTVFARPNLLGQDWEERKTREIMEKDNRP
jgi:hypothetical protein